MNPFDFRYPCGRTRRQFLAQMGNGFFGTALTFMLAKDGLLSNAARGATLPASLAGPSTARSGFRIAHLPARARSCIFLYMVGGPSQFDTFDPKPELTKRHGEEHTFTGTSSMSQKNKGPLKGAPWKFEKHGRSGTEVSELLPHLATCVDDMAILRGMHADSAAHGAASLQMNTGFIRQGFPSLGSWSTYGLGSANQNMPSFVVLVNGAPYGGAENWSSGFMPSAFQGTVSNPPGDPILNLKPASGAMPDEQRRQLDLLSKLDAGYRATEPANSELAARLSNYELAYRMQAAAPEVV